mgnify:FL=1|jgi:hypothetical protein
MITKQEAILTTLVERGYIGLNAEEAIPIGSTCLNSDVAAFKKLGVIISRKMETLPRSRGGVKHYMRYWITNENRPKAEKIINIWKAKREARNKKPA